MFMGFMHDHFAKKPGYCHHFLVALVEDRLALDTAILSFPFPLKSSSKSSQEFILLCR